MSLLDRLMALLKVDTRPAGERWGRNCPHCNWPSSIRSSHSESPVLWEQLRWCNNPMCGHTWIDYVEAHRTLSPSAIPNPNVHIPLSPHVRRDLVAAEMQRRPPAEQLSLLGEPCIDMTHTRDCTQ